MSITPDTPPARSVQELLEQYSALAYDHQHDLAEVIGDQGWQFDMGAGTIAFGPELVFPVQILGSFSRQSETWLWGWANEQSGIPAALLAQARQLQAYGAQHGIERLTTPSFEATEHELHVVGSIASGMFDASGYFLADYGPGIMLVTVKSGQVDRVRTDGFARILHAFPQAISFFELRHRPAFVHYLRQKRYQLTETADTVTATDGQASITASFDELGRLSRLTGSGGQGVPA